MYAKGELTIFSGAALYHSTASTFEIVLRRTNNSLFKMEGFHDETFSRARYADASWWGGYCKHRDFLFPTRRRPHCLHTEVALRSIPEFEIVSPQYSDELGNHTMANGVLGIFL
jgi:tyrosinase